jgi:pimeloyl-ACP methyl ester carboxylesterase
MSRFYRDRRRKVGEPGGLNGTIFGKTFSDIINVSLFDPGLNAMFWMSEQVGAVDHEAADYRALLILLNGRQTNYHCDPEHPPRWPVWRPGAAVDVYRGTLLGSNAMGSTFSFDFARHVSRYSEEVLFVAGSCSALGPAYQRKWNAPLFQRARVVEIPKTGHRLIQEDPEGVLAALRGYLAEYQGKDDK